MNTIVTPLKTAHAALEPPGQHVIENDNHFCIGTINFPMVNFNFILNVIRQKVNRHLTIFFTYINEKKLHSGPSPMEYSFTRIIRNFT